MSDSLPPAERTELGAATRPGEARGAGRWWPSVARFWAVLIARNKEFVRDRATLAWNLLFPFLVLVAFSFIFRSEGQPPFKVAQLGEASGQEQQAFLDLRHLQFVAVERLEEALHKLERHQYEMVLRLGETPAYWVNEGSPRGYLIERILWGAIPPASLAKGTVSGEPIRYVDWLLPGVLGMNIMFSCLIGVGFVIVRYRKNGVLRRLKATPLSALEFLTAQVVSRLLLVIVVTVIVFVGADLLLDLRMDGSWLDLGIVFLVGSFCLVCLGLLVSARLASEELAGGLLNLLTMPMMFLSGVWFSLEGAADWVRRVAEALPLTHMVDAARAIMLDGAGLREVVPEILVMGVMSFVFLVVGSWMFRWE